MHIPSPTPTRPGPQGRYGEQAKKPETTVEDGVGFFDAQGERDRNELQRKESK